jgi:hypothetical protein
LFTKCSKEENRDYRNLIEQSTEQNNQTSIIQAQIPYSTQRLHPLTILPSQTPKANKQPSTAKIPTTTHYSPRLTNPFTMSCNGGSCDNSVGLVPGKRITHNEFVAGWRSKNPNATSEDIAACNKFFEDMIRIGAVRLVAQSTYVMIPEQEFDNKIKEYMESKYSSGCQGGSCQQ